ncbi:MAG: N-6 DNA methylase, partial [Ferruginibacter sp.]
MAPAIPGRKRQEPIVSSPIPQRSEEFVNRRTIFDDLETPVLASNLFCDIADLKNEASVENFFVSRLLPSLGFKDSEILPKTAIQALPIPKGRGKENYAPDYVVAPKKIPRVVWDAKATSENVDDWTGQCSGYCLLINQKFKESTPVQYYVITNGLVTKIYPWDKDTAVLELDFEDFAPNNAKWIRFQQLLGAKAVRTGWQNTKRLTAQAEFHMVKPTIEEVKKVFAQCHRLIWKAEKKDPSSAFFAFVKLMFVKLAEDRWLHNNEKLAPLLASGRPIPAELVRFATHWIQLLQSNGIENPVDKILFNDLMDKIEENVTRNKKKRIFPRGETLGLLPSTVHEVVVRLQHLDMWGIDEDLNGRLFETFLGATMRGKDLGQYFTPRTIVKFMTKLADPTARPARVERCLDACCGSGGFLVDMLDHMRRQAKSNASLSDRQRETLLRQIAEESIYGVDAGTEPPLAQIARINLYLHDDGGSRIYAVDALDKDLQVDPRHSPEERSNSEELKRFLANGGTFDVVLTNPPFSMDYQMRLPNEARILAQYSLARISPEADELRPSLRSTIMFMERYHDVLAPSGRLVTVMDDSILSGPKAAFARDWLRRNFIVHAVISLPGDAFQRSGARTKTSVLYMVKKESPQEAQPAVFMAECQAIGLDDLPPTTRPSVVFAAKEAAQKESDKILADFAKFRAGQKGPWLVPAERIRDRMDVKYCLPRDNQAHRQWKKAGIDVVKVDEVLELAGSKINPADEPNATFHFLEVGYDGLPREGDTRLGREITYTVLARAAERDIVISHINAVHGAIGVVPKEMEHLVISSEYTIIRVKEAADIEPEYVWAILRSPEFRAAMISSASGGGRHRIKWDVLRRLEIPIIERPDQEKMAETLRALNKAAVKAKADANTVVAEVQKQLHLDNEAAVKRL